MKKSGQYQKILDKYLKADSKSSTSSTTADETTIWGLLQNNYKQLLSGLGVTLALALLSFAIAMVIGVIFGMFSVSPYKWLRWTAEIFVDVIRGIPLMILAAFIFWGIPNLIESVTGHQSPINDFVAGTIALSLNAAAYYLQKLFVGDPSCTDRTDGSQPKPGNLLLARPCVRSSLPTSNQTHASKLC